LKELVNHTWGNEQIGQLLATLKRSRFRFVLTALTLFKFVGALTLFGRLHQGTVQPAGDHVPFTAKWGSCSNDLIM
jgi:hypothetical protein